MHHVWQAEEEAANRALRQTPPPQPAQFGETAGNGTEGAG